MIEVVFDAVVELATPDAYLHQIIQCLDWQCPLTNLGNQWCPKCAQKSSNPDFVPLLWPHPTTGTLIWALIYTTIWGCLCIKILLVVALFSIRIFLYIHAHKTFIPYCSPILAPRAMVLNMITYYCCSWGKYFCYLSFENDPSHEQYWIFSTQGCFIASLIEIGPVLLEKKLQMYKVYITTRGSKKHTWACSSGEEKCWCCHIFFQYVYLNCTWVKVKKNLL